MLKSFTGFPVRNTAKWLWQVRQGLPESGHGQPLERRVQTEPADGEIPRWFSRALRGTAVAMVSA